VPMTGFLRWCMGPNQQAHAVATKERFAETP
jgi:hypothetical protein